MTPPLVNRATQIVTLLATGLIVPLCFVGGLVMARRNLQRGRGDRRGTFALATVSAALLALLYLAIEPHIRRIRPEMLVTWTRLVAGRWRDPMLGRDLVVASAGGVLLTVITFAHYLLPEWLSWPPFNPPLSRLAVLDGASGPAVVVLESADAALQNALLGGVGLMLAYLAVRRLVAAFALATVFFAFRGRGRIFDASRREGPITPLPLPQGPFHPAYRLPEARIEPCIRRVDQPVHVAHGVPPIHGRATPCCAARWR